MKFKKLDLLTLLIGLFTLASCKDTTNIGLDLDPNTAIQGKLVDTLTINSSTLLEAPAPTNTLARHPLGYLDDPIFGKTEASIALSVSVPNDAFDFGASPVLDSAVLVLNYGGQFYGDTTTSVYAVDVRQLANDIYPQESFLSNKVYATNPTVLGNRTAKVFPTLPFQITDIVTGKADTLKIVKPQMRIRLNTAFIQNNILNLSLPELKNNVAFAKAFKGLKVDLNKGASSGPLGVMFFSFINGGASNLELYYKKESSTVTGAIDTVLVKFPLDYTKNPIAATVTHDYAGTPVATQIANPTVKYPITYLKGLAGTRNKISFPSMGRLSAALGKVIVNRAELVIDLSTGTDVAPFTAAPRLSLYRSDIAAQRRNISDRDFFQAQFNSEAYGDIVFGGFYDGAKKRYIFVVTDYVQSLLDGKVEDYGTYLSVTPSTEFDYASPTVATASRSVIGSGAKDAAGNLINANNRIKLNIYYTKIN